MSNEAAGDVNYAVYAAGYSDYRKPEPKIFTTILQALGDAKTVLNVGAGPGSYEPTDRDVTAVEPSATMRAQRLPHLSQAVDAVAENLPFADQSFDASMATFTVHQWPDLKGGLSEMRRVTKGPVIILTCDPDLVPRFWLNNYAPEVLVTEAGRYPAIATIAVALGPNSEVLNLTIPLACSDGFNEAYYGRPELLLQEGARRACSGWTFVGAAVEQRFVHDLKRDLESGAWDRKYGSLRSQPEFNGSLRLVIGRA